jgi:hypothetical protein
MSAPFTLSEAIRWLEEEIQRVPFGKIMVGVQTHSGAVTKIFHSTEEGVAASPSENGRDRNGTRG